MSLQIKNFTDEQKFILINIFSCIKESPYSKYYQFKESVKSQLKILPDFIYRLCEEIAYERNKNVRAHYIRNSPIDVSVSKFDRSNLPTDKYEKKETFIGEVFLEVFSQLTDSPIMKFETTIQDFFRDVYSVTQQGKMPKDKVKLENLFWHNDTTYSKIMPDYVTVLCMRSCKDNLVYTSLIDYKEVIKYLDPNVQAILKNNYYGTPKKKNTNDRCCNKEIHKHAIIEKDYGFCYCSTLTQCLDDSPVEARNALISLHDAIIKSEKERVFLLNGNLLCYF
jgi:L-asparagine oxygenase